jgi:hypothetical protein
MEQILEQPRKRSRCSSSGGRTGIGGHRPSSGRSACSPARGGCPESRGETAGAESSRAAPRYCRKPIAGTRRIALEQEQKAHWTDRIHVAGGLTDAGKRTIALLKRVLTLTVKPGLDAAIALDFYKDPKSHEDPNKWKDTGAGSMVNMAKYYGHPDAFNDLVDSLAQVITEHPMYAGADFIVAAPWSQEQREELRRATRGGRGEEGRQADRATNDSEH